ncbi:radical SAM family heme chaperone HemW [Ekhidna sp.]|uniref:radical SAM family heme chaperone HemW n=1 Tax=Ekhidna sp. TaxID=2608089 RepID=UPI00329A37B9
MIILCIGLCNLAQIMAGIYIHIPFCRQACHYCDFHFSTNLTRMEEMVQAIGKEIVDRKEYLSEPIETIYFGGGTPSLLTFDQIKFILNAIERSHSISSEAEITLEANPEDLSSEKASQFFNAGINRLSIGIQTFDEAKLKWMNRIHDTNESLAAIKNVRNAGFQNISLDLIYAIPDHSLNKWQSDLEQIIELNPEHVSLYGLTIEDKTVFGKWEHENKLIQVPEDEAAAQYLLAIDLLKENDYLQYEVSNFGKEGYYSKHNNAYWSGVPYLGVGPGAHSFDGEHTRRFNVSNNAKYLKALQGDDIHFSENEVLSNKQRLNEMILTQLRTKKGLNLKAFEKSSGQALVKRHHRFLEEIAHQNLVEISNDFLRLKPRGFLVADEIALRLFLPE